MKKIALSMILLASCRDDRPVAPTAAPTAVPVATLAAVPAPPGDAGAPLPMPQLTPPATPLPKNVARDNALVAFPEAKCDEVGFDSPTLHSVRCTLKNGVKLYCTSGEAGNTCQPIFVPEEVQKAAAAAQEKANKTKK